MAKRLEVLLILVTLVFMQYILVTEDMIKTMKPGSVVVDVAIDQGGAVETCDHCIITHHLKRLESSRLR